MNQILITNLNDRNNENLNNTNTENEFRDNNIIDNENNIFFKKKSNIFFKIQFTLSIITVISIICFSSYYFYSLKTKEKMSENILGNYNIYKLYSNNNQEKEIIENNLFGIIEIPKINLYYPVLSNISEENLKVSPCKFYGGSLNENTNICIAGHNYNNDMFFSKINLLNPDDEIFIYDNIGVKYKYKVTEKYEVEENDLSPIYNYDNSQKTLTLVTCNNFNNNRFIIKSIQINLE